MNLYLESGYLDMQAIIESGYPFIFVPAARGTGKTYGSLKYHYQNHHKILLIRRTKDESDLQCSTETSAYKSVFDDLGIDSWKCEKSGGYGRVIMTDQEDPEVIALVAPLSTFSKIKGMDFSDIDYIIYDEFIPEPHVRKIKMEGMALANLYETVNRNRELKGKDPVQLLCLANSVNMANDVFMYFNLIDEAEKMLQEGYEISELGNKLLIIPQHSPISDQKSKTALYQAVSNEYSDMAIRNKFILNDLSYVSHRNLKEYTCIFHVGDLYCYEHKSKNEYYITFSRGQTKKTYRNGYADLARFRRDHWRFAGYYLDGMIRFENYHAVALWEKYFAI